MSHREIAVSTRLAQKARTRVRLLEAASEVFAEKSFANTSIGSITKAAGVAHGTFYVHFDSKEAVLDELLADFNRRFIERLSPVFAGAGSEPVDTLVRQTAEIFLDHWWDNRPFIESTIQRVAGGLTLEALRDGLSTSLIDTLAGVVSQVAGPTQPPGQANLFTATLSAMWFRIGLQYVFSDAVERESAIELLVSMTRGAAVAVFPSLSMTRSPA